MARASRSEPEPHLDPAPSEPKLRKCCGTCQGWKVSHMRASIGQCMPGSGMAPLITLDLATCSDWHPREGL